ncbi:helix-turn-helix transcriptional regulator [Nonomuraea sp. CA-143628]|uniref:helix-turn-helix transcriptional regulator n=1 Tax=Nonomuraea sp. CA-143628 TaxID=3239997 RepID=UPI003D8B54C1
MAEVHLTPDDLATRFRVPKKTIYKMNSDGTGPKYLRVGKHVRYREADVRGREDTLYARQ